MATDKTGTAGARPLSQGERAFIEGVAAHYHEAHGVTWANARTMGWMIISDPPEQTISQICAILGVRPADVDQLIEQLAFSGLYEVVERPGAERAYRLAERGYAKVVSDAFASWPDYLEIFRYGLEVLAGAPPQRRRRIAEIEELFSSIVPDLAEMGRRWRAIADEEGIR